MSQPMIEVKTLTPEDYEALAAHCMIAMLEFDAPATVRSLTEKAKEFNQKAAQLRTKKSEHAD